MRTITHQISLAEGQALIGARVESFCHGSQFTGKVTAASKDKEGDTYLQLANGECLKKAWCGVASWYLNVLQEAPEAPEAPEAIDARISRLQVELIDAKVEKARGGLPDGYYWASNTTARNTNNARYCRVSLDGDNYANIEDADHDQVSIPFDVLAPWVDRVRQQRREAENLA